LYFHEKKQDMYLVSATLPKQLIEYPDVKRSIKILFHSGIVMLTSPSKFLTRTIFLHAHLQAVYYNFVKFHLNPMSRLGGVVRMKKYGRCLTFGRGDNSTCTFTKRSRTCTL
jgi:hypothetical protein